MYGRLIGPSDISRRTRVLDGHVGAGTAGIVMNDGAQVTGNVLSYGPIDTGTASSVGGIYSTWNGAGNAVIVGEASKTTGSIYAVGNIELRGNAQIGTAANPVEVRTSGNLLLTFGNSDVYGDLYAGGSFTMLGASYDVWGDAHIGGAVSMENGRWDAPSPPVASRASSSKVPVGTIRPSLFQANTPHVTLPLTPVARQG